MKHKIVFTGLILLIVGCGSTQSVYELPPSERIGLVKQTYNYTKDEVYGACTNQLSDNGWVITNSDKSSGVISTEWRRVQNGKYRLKSSVLINEITSGKTEVKLNGQAQFNNPFGGWENEPITKKMAKKDLAVFFTDVNKILGQQ